MTASESLLLRAVGCSASDVRTLYETMGNLQFNQNEQAIIDQVIPVLGGLAVYLEAVEERD